MFLHSMGTKVQQVFLGIEDLEIFEVYSFLMFGKDHFGKEKSSSEDMAWRLR